MKTKEIRDEIDAALRHLNPTIEVLKGSNIKQSFAHYDSVVNTLQEVKRILVDVCRGLDKGAK